MSKFVVKTVASGVKFDLKATNGQTILTSEVYTSEAACKRGIASVAKNAPLAAVEDQTVEGYAVQKHPKFEMYQDKGGEFRFRLKARNGEIVVALFEDEATVKTLSRRDGHTWLLPENEAYAPIDGDNAEIIGKVVGVVRRY